MIKIDYVKRDYIKLAAKVVAGLDIDKIINYYNSHLESSVWQELVLQTAIELNIENWMIDYYAMNNPYGNEIGDNDPKEIAFMDICEIAYDFLCKMIDGGN